MTRTRHARGDRRLLARHSAKAHTHHIRHAIGLVCVTALALVGSMGVSTWAMLQGNIQRADVDELLGTDRPSAAAPTSTVSDPTDPFGGSAVNILLMGSDSRLGDNEVVGGEYDGMRADTTMLVHVAANRTRVDVVSIPRDAMVQIPACTRTDGTATKAQFGQFNSAFALGGQNKDTASAAACAQKTVEQLTGIRIDGFVVVDMLGFASVIQTLGGIDVCVPKAINLPTWGLVVDAGMQHLDGMVALEYARVRHGIGDGSDIQRIDRQKVVMSAVAHKALESSLLTSPTRLLPFLNATTSTLHTSGELGSLTSLAGFGFSLRNMSLDNIAFYTAPWGPYPKDTNRVQLTKQADDLFELLRDDQPVPGSPAYQAAQAAAAAAAAAAAGTGSGPGGTDPQAAGSTPGAGGPGDSAGQATPTQGAVSDPTAGSVSAPTGIPEPTQTFDATSGLSATSCG